MQEIYDGGVELGVTTGGGVAMQRPPQVIVWVQNDPAGQGETPPTIHVCVKGFVGVGVVVVVFFFVFSFFAITVRASEKVTRKLMVFIVISSSYASVCK